MQDNFTEYPVNKCITCCSFLASFETSDKILQAIYSLTTREYLILTKGIVEGKKVKEVGKDAGITVARVIQVRENSIRKVLNNLRKQNIDIKAEELINFIQKNKEKMAWVIKKEILVIEEQRSLPTVFVESTKNITVKSYIESNRFEKEDIDILDLRMRPHNCLRVSGINTVGQLVENLRNKELFKIKNMGRKSIEEITFALKIIGIDVEKEK